MKDCTSCTIRVNKETNFQRRRRLDKARRKYREKRMREAEAERALNLEKLRLYLEGQTEENNPSLESQCLSNLGSEAQKIIKEIQTRRERKRKNRAQRKANEPVEKRDSRRAKARSCYYKKMAEERTEEKKNRMVLKNLSLMKFIPETPEEHRHSLEKQQIKNAIKRAENKFLLNLVQHLHDDITE